MRYINWDAIRARLPIYAYEYEKFDDEGNVTKVDFWYPRDYPKGTEPPAGWTNIDRDDSHPELWRSAADAWLKEVVRPNEKAVWLNMDDGHFSNTFKLGELLAADSKAITDAAKQPNWKLIIYRCETDENFEFSDMMKIVTKTKEDRKRKTNAASQHGRSTNE